MVHAMKSPTIRTMVETDLPSVLLLSTSVGWNQTAADWQRMLLLEPNGCFVAAENGQIVGTTLCCTFGPVAWLAMVIVREDRRGSGLGRELVRGGLEYAQKQGVRTVRLDATPLGETVYRKLGFLPQFELRRVGGIVRTKALPAFPAYKILSATTDQFAELIQLDHETTATQRGKLLSRLFSEWSPLTAVSPDGKIQAFLASRKGRLATQFGPMSGKESAAVDLLSHALTHSSAQSVIADIPVHRESLLELARSFGLSEQRTLLRMYYGEKIIESPERFHLSYGGEFG